MKKVFKILGMCLLLIGFSSQITHAIPIEGNSSGIFTNPSGPSGMVTTGVGTDYFTWGSGSPPSSLHFSGNSFSVNTDDVFSFGTLMYYNGTIASGSEADAVELNVSLTLTNPSGINQAFDYNLGLINTVNTSDPDASADYVNFISSIPNTVFTVDGADYTLEFLGIGTITGPGFSTIDSFHVLENKTASAQLLGRVTSDFEPVPEPSTMLLLGIGLGSIGLLKRKKIIK